MLCVLVFVGFNQAFINGAGSVLFKYCYYDCNNVPKNYAIAYARSLEDD